jgi:hypothetical protein
MAKRIPKTIKVLIPVSVEVEQNGSVGVFVNELENAAKWTKRGKEKAEMWANEGGAMTARVNHVVWIEAEVPVPQPAKTVKGTVK